MNQYILLIHRNVTSDPSEAEWSRFFEAAQRSGLFKGGSAIGGRVILGDTSVRPSHHISGFMRFDSDDRSKITELLGQHPVVLHGGTVELCEMPKT